MVGNGNTYTLTDIHRLFGLVYLKFYDFEKKKDRNIDKKKDRKKNEKQRKRKTKTNGNKHRELQHSKDISRN